MRISRWFEKVEASLTTSSRSFHLDVSRHGSVRSCSYINVRRFHVDGGKDRIRLDHVCARLVPFDGTHLEIVARIASAFESPSDRRGSISNVDRMHEGCDLKNDREEPSDPSESDGSRLSSWSSIIKASDEAISLRWDRR